MGARVGRRPREVHHLDRVRERDAVVDDQHGAVGRQRRVESHQRLRPAVGDQRQAFLGKRLRVSDELAGRGRILRQQGAERGEAGARGQLPGIGVLGAEAAVHEDQPVARPCEIGSGHRRQVRAVGRGRSEDLAGQGGGRPGPPFLDLRGGRAVFLELAKGLRTERIDPWRSGAGQRAATGGERRALSCQPSLGHGIRPAGRPHNRPVPVHVRVRGHRSGQCVRRRAHAPNPAPRTPAAAGSA